MVIFWRRGDTSKVTEPVGFSKFSQYIFRIPRQESLGERKSGQHPSLKLMQASMSFSGGSTVHVVGLESAESGCGLVLSHHNPDALKDSSK